MTTQYVFFDRELVLDPSTKEPYKVFSNLQDFEADGFQAYTGAVLLMAQAASYNVLVTVGQDKEAMTPVIKLWNLDPQGERGGSRLLRSIKLKLAATQEATCVAVLNDVTQIAVGLSDGTVVLYGPSNLLKDSGAPKRTDLLEPSDAAVTGLGFCWQEGGHPISPVLFVTTTRQIITIVTTRLVMQYVDRERGCGPRCFVMTDSQLLATGDDRLIVTYYNPREMIRSFPVFFPDCQTPRLVFVNWLGSYIIVVVEEKDRHLIRIYDQETRYLFEAYSETMGLAKKENFSKIAHLVCEWGTVLLFCTDGSLWRLREKDRQSKLDLVFKRQQYDFAIAIADAGSIHQIRLKKADLLYQRSQFEQAINEYIETIGFWEPSYVIGKYLDGPKIIFLTRYLQALHRRGKADAEHTTLLLNCYTKLKDIDKLKEFIRSGGQELSFNVEAAIRVCRQAGYKEDALELAMQHREHGWCLKIMLDDLRDSNGALRAIQYINTLTFDEAVANVKKYGKTLLVEVPEQTTQLLKDLCTNYQPVIVANSHDEAHHVLALGGASSALDLKKVTEKSSLSSSNITTSTATAATVASGGGPGTGSAVGTASSSSAAASTLLDIAKKGLAATEKAAASTMHMLDLHKSNSGKTTDDSGLNNNNNNIINNNNLSVIPSSSNPYGLPPLPDEWLPHEKPVASSSNNNFVAKAATMPVKKKALPDDLLHIFVEEEKQLVKFLEYVCQKEDCSPVIYTTLLEAYLREKDNHIREGKVLALLKDPRAKFDNDQALVLCRMYQFGAGVLALYQRMELYQEILSHHMEQKKFDLVIETCKSFGERDPLLWVQALAYFARQSNCEKELKTVLERIEKLQLLSPLRVIHMLSVTPTATLGVVRDFVIRNLMDQNALIEKHQQEIKKSKDEIDKNRSEIEAKTKHPVVFQQSKCDSELNCMRPLDRPSVHFLCMHSFHRDCLDNEFECPRCAKTHQAHVDTRKVLQESSKDHDVFFKQLHGAPDGFAVVAEFFGRDCFTQAPAPRNPAAASSSAIPNNNNNKQ